MACVRTIVDAFTRFLSDRHYEVGWTCTSPLLLQIRELDLDHRLGHVLRKMFLAPAAGKLGEAEGGADLVVVEAGEQGAGGPLLDDLREERILSAEHKDRLLVGGAVQAGIRIRDFIALDGHRHVSFLSGVKAADIRAAPRPSGRWGAERCGPSIHYRRRRTRWCGGTGRSAVQPLAPLRSPSTRRPGRGSDI